MAQQHESRRIGPSDRRAKGKRDRRAKPSRFSWFDPPLIIAPWCRRRTTLLGEAVLFLFLSFVCRLPWLGLLPALGLLLGLLSGNVPLYVARIRILYVKERLWASLVVLVLIAVSFLNASPLSYLVGFLKK
jgi:hypothetical protein